MKKPDVLSHPVLSVIQVMTGYPESAATRHDVSHDGSNQEQGDQPVDHQPGRGPFLFQVMPVA